MHDSPCLKYVGFLSEPLFILPTREEWMKSSLQFLESYYHHIETGEIIFPKLRKLHDHYSNTGMLISKLWIISIIL